MKLASECIAAVERGRHDDGWVAITIGGEYGIATAVGKSAKRARGDVQKLVDWGFIEKRVVTERVLDELVS